MGVEERLRKTLADQAASVRPKSDAWTGMERRLVRRTATSRALAGAVALSLAVLSIGVLWVSFFSNGNEPGSSGGGAELTDLSPSLSGTVDVGGRPDDLAFGEEAVWVSVTTRDALSQFILRLDPETDLIEARVPLAGPVDDVVVGEGSVWATYSVPTDGATTYRHFVVRIDPATNQVVATIPDVSAPLAVGGGSVWGSDGDGALVQIDPTRAEIISRIALGVRPWAMALADQAMWVLPLESNDQEILRVDLGTGSVTARAGFAEDLSVYGPVAGGGAVWVPVVDAQGAQILRLAPQTGDLLERIPVPSIGAFAIAAGRLWLLDERGALNGLNISTLTVDESLEGLPVPTGASIKVTADADPSGRIWVAGFDGTVARVELT